MIGCFNLRAKALMRRREKREQLLRKSKAGNTDIYCNQLQPPPLATKIPCNQSPLILGKQPSRSENVNLKWDIRLCLSNVAGHF